MEVLHRKITHSMVHVRQDAGAARLHPGRTEDWVKFTPKIGGFQRPKPWFSHGVFMVNSEEFHKTWTFALPTK